ncbi:MAG: LysE family translocator [Gammaproteobacteria bacterium]
MTIAPPDWQLLFLASAASAAAAFTPGPNNAICMSAAVNFGFRRALPFAFGVTVGFPLLIAATGAGLGQILSHLPRLHDAIKIFGALFLLHLAWKIASARGDGGGGKGAPGFFRAVAFQWINPKAVTYAFSIVAAFARPGAPWNSDIAYLSLVCAAVSLASTLTWAAFGAGIGRFLKTPRARAAFNGVMGALLALTAAMILFL